jgi:aryl-alcohol dehydrogenase-like predicted oxidoreductase
MLFGQFRKAYTASSPDVSPPIGCTKWCIFKIPSVPITRAFVEDAVRERIARMRGDGLDMLQIHWQDYNDAGYLPVLGHLIDIKRERTQRLEAIGLVNFDSEHLDEICSAFGSGDIASNQVQFSLVDTRPLAHMAEICRKHGVKILAYGVLCGGFLSERWLGLEQPDPYFDHLTPSQRKYLDVILGAWGGWELFQSLLHTLKIIGTRHGSFSISNVATRWVLDHDFVASAIVGTRLGVAEHKDDNSRVFEFKLTAEDKGDIDDVLVRSNGGNLINLMGDSGAEYR